MNRTILTLLLTEGAIVGTGIQTSVKAASNRSESPNILLILVDDLGWGDLSCQYATDLYTPNIDSLFTQGVRLDNFYANSSVSSPSRAGLLTGRYPELVGVPGVIRTQPSANWGYLDPNATFLPEMLHKAGYKTAIIGKWHLGLESPNLPNERGFDYFHGFLGDMMDSYTTHLRQGHNYMRLNDRQINPKGHATELFTQWAQEYLENSRTDNKPFFLYLAYNAPHLPLDPPAEWEQRVRKRQPDLSPQRAKLIALIEHLDANIGKVMSTLRQNNLLQNTLVIFCSDNGGDPKSEANNGPIRGNKGDMFEGGIRVACTIYWPVMLAPGRRDQLVMMSDLFPTLCELTGVQIEHPIDGISVWPLLQGEQQETDERFVFWIRREHGDFGGKTQSAVLYKGYKLLQNRPFDPLLYFNLTNDPYERTPLPQDKTFYPKLYKAMIEHYRLSGTVPWQKPLTSTNNKP